MHLKEGCADRRAVPLGFVPRVKLKAPLKAGIGYGTPRAAKNRGDGARPHDSRGLKIESVERQIGRTSAAAFTAGRTPRIPIQP